MRYSIILSISFLITFCSCSSYLHTIESDSDATEIYEEFWSHIDEHYMFFGLKNIDWATERDKALSLINDGTTEEELFEICDQSLLALQDAHCWLNGPGLNNTPFDITEGYVVHFSLKLVLDEYIVDTLDRSGALYYGWLPDQVGYIYFRAMSQYGGFNRIVRDMKAAGAKGLVIDVRDNSGGDSDPIPALLGNFTDESILLGSYVEKSGPGHEDKTDLLEIYSLPSEDGFLFDLPVTMITNRRGYSATTYFAAMAKEIPAITVVGQKTGGGAGGNMGYQLSNGWVMAISVSDYIDVDGSSIELGVEPDVTIENTAQDVDKDPMLEKAIDIILGN